MGQRAREEQTGANSRTGRGKADANQGGAGQGKHGAKRGRRRGRGEIHGAKWGKEKQNGARLNKEWGKASIQRIKAKESKAGQDWGKVEAGQGGAGRVDLHPAPAASRSYPLDP